MRKIAIYTAAILTLLLLLAIIIPPLFKPQVIQAVKEQANSSLNGKFDFSDISLSLFKDIPNLSLTIENPSCLSYSNQDTSLLFKGEEFTLSLNLWNIIFNADKIQINAFKLLRPEINIIQYDSLRSNLQILKDTTNSADSNSKTSLEISEYSISDGQFTYVDLSNHSRFTMKQMNHEGSVLQSESITKINSITDIAAISYAVNGISFLENLHLNSAMDLTHDSSLNKYQFAKADFKFNKLNLSLNGGVQLLKDSVLLDVAILSPSNHFEDIFSIIPKAYTSDYKSIESSGNFNFSSTIKGVFSSINKLYPNWDFKCLVENGSLKYPSKKVKLNKVNLDIQSSNKDPYGKGAEFNINSFTMDLLDQNVAGQLSVKDFLQDPALDGKLKGVINLSNFSEFFPLENGSSLSGNILMDLLFKFKESAILKDAYSELAFDGSIQCNQVNYTAKDIPAIALHRALFNFKPQVFSMESFELNFGKSDLSATGVWNQPLRYFTNNGTVKASISSNSHLIDLTEWLVSDTNMADSPSSKMDVSAFNGIELSFQSTIQKLVYPDYKINNLSANGKWMGNQLIFDQFNATINENAINGKASFDNLMAYMFNDQILNGTIHLKSQVFDADKFLKIDSTQLAQQSKNEEAFQIPPTFNFDIQFDIAQLIYRPLKMNDVKGKIQVVDSDVQFHDIYSNALGGKMYLNGIFSTKDPEKPKFNIKYDLSQVQFSNTFNSMLSIKKLAPIMQYIQGFFNSNLILEGQLDKMFNPVLESINVDGFIETLDGSIKGFKPLDQIANKLNINELKTLNLKNTKNWLSVKNGYVTVKDFNKKIEDIGLTIGGTHKINGDMDYKFLFNIPKSKIDKISKAVQLEKGMEKISNALSKTGFGALNQKSLNILVNLKGGLMNPIIGMKLVNESGQEQNESNLGEEIKSNIKDSMTKRGEQELNKIKNQAELEINKYQDSLQKLAKNKTENIKDELIDKSAKEANKVLDSNLVNKAKSVLKNPLDSVIKPGDKLDVDEIKNKMKDWNPFKKEKK